MHTRWCRCLCLCSLFLFHFSKVLLSSVGAVQSCALHLQQLGALILKEAVCSSSLMRGTGSALPSV